MIESIIKFIHSLEEQDIIKSSAPDRQKIYPQAAADIEEQSYWQRRFEDEKMLVQLREVLKDSESEIENGHQNLKIVLDVFLEDLGSSFSLELEIMVEANNQSG